MAKKPAKAESKSGGKGAAKPALERAEAAAPQAVAQHPPAVALGTILGQDRAVETLRSAIRSGRIHHAWIFHGPSGVGKFTTALAFAAMILDPTTQETLGGELEADPDSHVQGLIRAGSHPDLHVITKELARFSEDRSVRERKLLTIPKEVVEEHLLKPSALAPAMRTGSMVSKVFIVDEAELLDRSPTNAPTQNALLKTLEEPPEGTVIILVTSSEDQLLATIRSRCQRVPFGPLDEGAMKSWLKRAKVEAEADEREWLLGFAGGSPGALLMARGGGMYAWWTKLQPMLTKVDQGKYDVGLAPAMTQLVDEWAEAWVKSHDNASKESANRAGADWMLRLLGEHFRGLLRAAATAGEKGAERAARAADALDVLREGERRLDANVNAIFVYEGIVADLVAVFAGEAMSS